MICPMDDQPCTGDHSTRCRDDCRRYMNRSRAISEQVPNARGLEITRVDSRAPYVYAVLGGIVLWLLILTSIVLSLKIA